MFEVTGLQWKMSVGRQFPQVPQVCTTEHWHLLSDYSWPMRWNVHFWNYLTVGYNEEMFSRYSKRIFVFLYSNLKKKTLNWSHSSQYIRDETGKGQTFNILSPSHSVFWRTDIVFTLPCTMDFQSWSLLPCLLLWSGEAVLGWRRISVCQTGL